MQQLSQTDICNLALMQLGQRKIQSITSQNDANAIACNVAWSQAFGSVARETPWNCLKAIWSCGQLIPPTTQTTYGTNIPSTATTWAPGTNYAVNAYVIYAGYLYQCLIANTSSNSFTVDLTRGYWFETTTFSPNFFGFPVGNTAPGAGWTFAYALPADFIYLVELNGNSCWSGWGWNGSRGTQGASHEIFGRSLYCNATYANIKYVKYETDTALYDSLFTDALILKLAAMIATDLRKDDAGLSMRLMQEYQAVISNARATNAGEDKLRRYNIVSESRFVRSRYRSTNG